MDKRVRRFGLPKQPPSKDCDFVLRWTSKNGCWDVILDKVSENVGKHGKKFRIPLSGRVIDNRTGRVEYWLRTRFGDIKYDHPERIPEYVRHAVDRVDTVGIPSIGRKTLRNVPKFRRAKT